MANSDRRYKFKPSEIIPHLIFKYQQSYLRITIKVQLYAGGAMTEQLHDIKIVFSGNDALVKYMQVYTKEFDCIKPPTFTFKRTLKKIALAKVKYIEKDTFVRIWQLWNVHFHLCKSFHCSFHLQFSQTIYHFCCCWKHYTNIKT